MQANDYATKAGMGASAPFAAMDERKTFATMQARAALCGCTLHELADGGYLVARWNYSRAVPCLRAVGDMLRQMGGGNG